MKEKDTDSLRTGFSDIILRCMHCQAVVFTLRERRRRRARVLRGRFGFVFFFFFSRGSQKNGRDCSSNERLVGAEVGQASVNRCCFSVVARGACQSGKHLFKP